LVAREATSAAIRFEEFTRPPKDKATLYGLITRYLSSIDGDHDRPPPHLRKLAPRTLSDRRKHLDKVRADLGKMEVLALEATAARRVLIKWRDSQARTPKSADDRLYALSCVLDWAVDQGELTRNPIAHFTRIYEVDRSEIVWTRAQLETLYEHADPAFSNFVRVSVMTGIRMGDLRALPLSAIGEDSIVFQSGKSRKRRTVVVPIFDELRAALASIRPSGKSTTLLNSSKGRPWSEAGLESALRRARMSVQAEAEDKLGKDAKSPIAGLRIHDLRGTAATNFMRWGVDDDEIATIMGWKREQVREIRKRYVSGEEIGRAMVRRIRENKPSTESVKPAVKSC
jgi:site-specific recombinase XerD